MSYLTINNITLQYNSTTQPALDDVSLSMENGELLVLAGASGSGKSSLLRVIAGLEQPQKGEIKVKETVLFSKQKNIPPNKRKVGMVFQDYALFPHKTVTQNVGYGIKKSKEKATKIQNALALVGLENHGNRYPHQLSGGEQQRVAIARAIAPKPAVLLLDEPFSNLDENLKDEVRTEIKNIVKQSGITTVLVTHDTRDALSIADKIAILKEGVLQQVASPTIIYQQPTNKYVAQFFDKANILTITPNFLKLLRLNLNYQNKTILLRPQNIELTDNQEDSFGKLIRKQFLGNRFLLDIELDNKVVLMVYSEFCKAAIGEKVSFRIKNPNIWTF